MKLNLKVRAKNPVFWINLSVSLMGIILAYFGLNWEQMTTWKSITDMLFQAIQNPVVVIAALGCIWNALNDPTTAGLSDSARALNYKKPYK